jgi:hypothetical protein
MAITRFIRTANLSIYLKISNDYKLIWTPFTSFLTLQDEKLLYALNQSVLNISSLKKKLVFLWLI